ncbi:class II aldolase/adducin family protein [Brachybacterium sacelli]|uniref:L-fuculose-phosphate aldolase n=1 Tax=Brachybacterium sacelli TaxID=173364 RepID=A0ABS4X109_9MICO|nr:class II aldolase/adducin family protein [Brachybacterium sacelli]MBP2381414.1 L-fuculose-phosphate aldolase [Brachybacterium sacelli]
MTVMDDLIAAGRALVDAGLSPGTSGNISARDGDRLLVSGTGAPLGALDPSDFAVVSLGGTVLGGAKASKETPLHLGFYGRSSGNHAVVHVHSPQATAFSCTEPWSRASAIPPLTPYFVMRVGSTPLLPYRMPGSPQLGDDVLEAPGEFRAALLANHGSVVAGISLPDAVERAVEVEEACRIALLTASAPRRELTDEQTADLSQRWQSPWTTPTVD